MVSRSTADCPRGSASFFMSALIASRAARRSALPTIITTSGRPSHERAYSITFARPDDAASRDLRYVTKPSPVEISSPCS